MSEYHYPQQDFDSGALPPEAYTGDPLSRPLYRANPKAAFVRFWSKFAVFSGRASRSEFWWMQLLWMMIYFVVVVLASNLDAQARAAGPVTGDGPSRNSPGHCLRVLLLAILIPQLAFTWRRLHDANMSGAVYFPSLIPVIGSIIVLVLLILPPSPAGARFDRSWSPSV